MEAIKIDWDRVKSDVDGDEKSPMEDTLYFMRIKIHVEKQIREINQRFGLVGQKEDWINTSTQTSGAENQPHRSSLKADNTPTNVTSEIAPKYNFK